MSSMVVVKAGSVESVSQMVRMVLNGDFKRRDVTCQVGIVGQQSGQGSFRLRTVEAKERPRAVRAETRKQDLPRVTVISISD